MGGSGAPPDDARERFTGAAEVYARWRPSYPAPLIDWIAAEAGLGPGDRVVDVGCGTGILTRLLAARGFDVLGIDPNEDMLEQARRTGGARYERADASATGAADASVRLVTVAQAAHWLELDTALAEFARILAPGGRVAAIYNLRAETTLQREYEGLVRRFSSEHDVIRNWETTLAALASHPRVLDPRRMEVEHAQRLDVTGLLGRAWSSSYVFRGVRDRDGFDVALRALHAAHAREGVVEFAYRAVALVFTAAHANAV